MKETDISYLLKDFKEFVPTEETPAGMLEKAQIRLTDDIMKLPAVISIKNGFQIVDIFTEGNISVIQGKAKARKTFAITMFLSAYLRIDPLYMKMIGQTRKWCILFDTEQSSFYVQQVMRRVYRLSEESEFSSRFMVFCLRPFTPDTRMRLIEYVVRNVKNLGFIVIDGIRDLIKDINSQEEATMITSRLLKWTEDTGAHILTVIHENKADGKARGAIGTELINKAETVLKVEKNEIQSVFSKLTCEYTRGLSFDDITFQIDDDLPVLADAGSIDEFKTDNGKSPF